MAKNLAFALMGFGLMLNFACGVMFTLIPTFGADTTLTTNFKYEQGYDDTFTVGMEQEIRPSGGAVEDKGSAIWRVLDMINIGFIAKLGTLIKNYIFGFIKLLGLIVGPLLSPEMNLLLFTGPVPIMYAIMSIVYVTGMFSLWTNRFISRYQ